MTVAETALRARSYEAADLKGLLSTHAAGRSIPYFIKVRDGSHIRTFSSNSGRVRESSERKSIDDLVKWMYGIIQKINSSATDKSFLNSFAKKVSISEVLKNSKPRAILLESSAISRRIKDEGIEIKYKTKKKKLISVPGRILTLLTRLTESVYEFDDNGAVIGHEKVARVKINKKTLTFDSGALSRFWVEHNGKESTFQKFIIKNGFYSICFDDPKYMYFMRSCFKDVAGISEIDSIIELLHPVSSLATAKSEKGELKTKFIKTSLFDIVEKHHKNDDYIFCDDFGDEWADHITLNKSESTINFIHSKHGDLSSSASKFHEVVGQGIKNLGNMHFTKHQFMVKVNKKFNGGYRNQPRLARTRKGDLTKIDVDLDSVLADFRLQRRCILACSFISKNQLRIEFQKLKQKKKVRGNITQILWILSSFAHAAKEMHVRPIIYCLD